MVQAGFSSAVLRTELETLLTLSLWNNADSSKVLSSGLAYHSLSLFSSVWKDAVGWGEILLSVCKERDDLLMLVQVYPEPKNRSLVCHTVMNETENQCSTQLYWKAGTLQRIASSYMVCLHRGKISSFLFLFLFISCSQHDHPSQLLLTLKKTCIVCPCAIQEAVWQSWAFCTTFNLVQQCRTGITASNGHGIIPYPTSTSLYVCSFGEVGS